MPQLLDLVARAVAQQPADVRAGGNGRGPGGPIDAIIGKSPAMQAIYKEIGRVAAKPVNVS